MFVYVLSSAALLMPPWCLTCRLPSSSFRFQSLPVLSHCFESSVLVTPGLLPDGSFNSVNAITFFSFCNPDALLRKEPDVVPAASAARPAPPPSLPHLQCHLWMWRPAAAGLSVSPERTSHAGHEQSVGRRE